MIINNNIFLSKINITKHAEQRFKERFSSNINKMILWLSKSHNAWVSPKIRTELYLRNKRSGSVRYKVSENGVLFIINGNNQLLTCYRCKVRLDKKRGWVADGLLI